MADSSEPSRHFLGCKAQKVRWLPAGLSLNYGERVLVTGGYHPDIKETCLAIHSVKLSLDESGGATGRPPSIDLIKTWRHKGSFTDLQVVPTGSGDACLLSASSDGLVSLVKLRLPSGPRRGVGEITLVDDDGSGACAPWLRLGPRSGEVAGIDTSEALEVAVATRGGLLSVASLGSALGQPPQTLFDSGGYSAFSAVRWASPSVLLTAGSAPGVAAWDRRAASSASGPELRAGGGPAGGPAGGPPARYACIDTLEAQMHVCVGGGEGGEITLWDLRYPDKAVSFSAQQQRGPATAGACVWEVKFDTVAGGQGQGQGQGSAAERVLACSADGILQRAGPGGASNAVLANEVAMSVNSFAIEPTVGLELAAVTDGEHLLYWSAEAREDIVYGGH